MEQDGALIRSDANRQEHIDPVSEADLFCAIYKRHRTDEKDLVPNSDIPGLYPSLSKLRSTITKRIDCETDEDDYIHKC